MTDWARSCWPRNGVDQGNRSQSSVTGPVNNRLRWRLPLPKLVLQKRNRSPLPAIAVADDGSLRVTSCGVLHAVSMEGRLLWSRSLRTTGSGTQSVLAFSAPVTLPSNRVFVATTHDKAIEFDSAGQILHTYEIEGPLDDSGFAPNVTADGRVLLTAIPGELSILNEGATRTIGSYGYDLPPPAIFDDGTLAVAGYYGAGYCRLRTDGTFVWKSRLHQADGLPSIARDQFSATHSLNDGCSVIFDPEGQECGRIPWSALFAESLDDGWARPRFRSSPGPASSSGSIPVQRSCGHSRS
jgi:outer membrane protein assembly factor BamB